MLSPATSQDFHQGLPRPQHHPRGTLVTDTSPSNTNYGIVDLSFYEESIRRSTKSRSRANQATRLKREHNDALNQLKDVDKRINSGSCSNQIQDSPLKPLSLQRRTVNKFGLGQISNRQSFGLAAITILLGITAIIGRVE